MAAFPQVTTGNDDLRNQGMTDSAERIRHFVPEPWTADVEKADRGAVSDRSWCSYTGLAHPQISLCIRGAELGHTKAYGRLMSTSEAQESESQSVTTTAIGNLVRSTGNRTMSAELNSELKHYR